jgi:hypothetical protein
MTDSPTCPTCDQPIHVDESVYFWPERQTMEHLWCHVRWFVAEPSARNISAEYEASADPAYGPMS